MISRLIISLSIFFPIWNVPIKLFFEGDTRARDLDENMTHDQTLDSQVQSKLGHAVVISSLFGKYTIE